MSSQTGKQIRAVIFDGDDTLWLTESLYDDARRCARQVVADAGLDADEWEEVQRARDLHNVGLLGHNAERFPKSCAEAFSLVGGDSLPDASEVRERLLVAARSVFYATAPLRAGAPEVLRELRARGMRLALLTKGDADVQQRRIDQSGLASFFDVVMVVEMKLPESFVSAAHALNVELDELISVGNSIASDISPSMAAGIEGLWIPAYTWEFEQRHDPALEMGTQQISDLRELLTLTAV